MVRGSSRRIGARRQRQRKPAMQRANRRYQGEKKALQVPMDAPCPLRNPAGVVGNEAPITGLRCAHVDVSQRPNAREDAALARKIVP